MSDPAALLPSRRASITHRRPLWARLRARVLRMLRRRLRVPLFYTPSYRIPIPSIEALSGQEPRRADFVTWYLVEERLMRDREIVTPPRAEYDAISRVHDASYLESLSEPEALARIFAVSPGEIVVDEVMHTVRLAVGGTIAASRLAVDTKASVFNLMGGFHHAGPAVGGGYCALNDIAIAIAQLRSDGYKEQIVILDLDAHPPDGLAACLVGDAKVKIGSISGSEWGALIGAVDETFLPGADDDTYLAALRALLGRMPRPALAFVLAGGDVLAGDRLGALSLTLAGVRERDLLVAEWLDRTPSVWLPAGGYSDKSWKVLVGAYLAVTRRSRRPVKDKDPMMSRYAAIARGLSADRLSGGGPDDWSLEDVETELYGRPIQHLRLLGYYTIEGIEYALARYGVLDHVRRLGYTKLVINIEPPDDVGQRVTVHGNADGQAHLLIDLIVKRDTAQGEPALVVHWLSLRNPRAAFVDGRKPLPGQEVPGLGLARDMGQLLGRMAERLGLPQVALRPAYLHSAYAARNHFHFCDPARQQRFISLLADLGDKPLSEITRALSEGRVRMDGAPYAWEADLMIYRPEDPSVSLQAPAGPRPRFTLVS